MTLASIHGLRSHRSQVRILPDALVIDVLIAGEYPGDGKPKPVRFPDPAEVAIPREHGSFLPLPKLLELKLASGMTAPHRLKDLADVLELVRAAALPRTLATELDASVRSRELRVH